ncbi:MAG: hypothetical protein ACKVUS_01090 [Saprospiraceae bacterium]
MTRLLTRCFFLIFPLLLFGIASCNKDKTTIVNGTVVDKVTGEPIDSAFIEFKIQHKDDYTANSYEYVDIYSNENGGFSFQSGLPLSIFWVKKKGYLPKGLGTHIVDINQGKANDITVEMIPLDGVLELNIENALGVSDTLYVSIYSPFRYSELGLSHGVASRDTFFVQHTHSATSVIRLASEETINIYWDLSPLPFDISAAPNQGSVYVARSDTATFNITF